MRIALSAFAILLFAMPLLSQANVPEDRETAYIYVDGSKGSDSNPGTEERPLATIKKGAVLAVENNEKGIGSRVIINPGTYREYVDLPHTRRETDAPVTFQAAQAGTVIVSGADVWTGWRRSPQNPKIFVHAWPFNWGSCPLPRTWPAVEPIVLRREMIFINGTPLAEVLSSDQLRPGRFYVDEARGDVYLYPPSGTTMSTAVVEVARRAELFGAYGKRNIALKGLTFQYANTCIGKDAVQFYGSRNILVQDSSFLWNNYSGFGVDRSSDVTVRKILANHNGGGGFGGAYLRNVLYEDAEGSYNNWRGAQGGFVGWDPSGAKFLLVHKGAFRRLKAVGNQAYGLWFDTDNADITVEGALLTQNLLSGLELEANPGPLIIKDGCICNNSRQDTLHGGISSENSENVTITGNLIYNNAGHQILIDGDPNGRYNQDWENGKEMSLLTRGWMLTGNMIVGAKASQVGIETALPEDDWSKTLSTFVSDRNHWFNASRIDFFQLRGPLKAGWRWSNGENLPVPGNEFTDLAGWRTVAHQDSDSVFAPPSEDLDMACSTARNTAGQKAH